MAEALEMKKQSKDITECSICTSVYSDPKILPCIHTFCLKCIEGWWKDKQPGDKVSCPICRTEFAVPSGGFLSLPNNFFVSKLLEIKMLTNKMDEIRIVNYCNLCHEVDDKSIPASLYCLNCEQYLCSSCGRYHQKHKFSKSHKVLATEEGGVRERDVIRQSVRFCEQHQEDTLRLYCFDCKSTICMMCFVEEHQSHKCSNVDKVAEEFREQLDGDIMNVTDRLAKISEKALQLQKSMSEFMEQIATIETSITKKGEELKQLIDRQLKSLLQELTIIKQGKLKEIETVKQELEREIVMLEDFKIYCKELKDKGAPCEVARVADCLHKRAKELQIASSSCNDLNLIDVIFLWEDLKDFLKEAEKTNVIGTLTTKIKYFSGRPIKLQYLLTTATY